MLRLGVTLTWHSYQPPSGEGKQKHMRISLHTESECCVTCCRHGFYDEDPGGHNTLVVAGCCGGGEATPAAAAAAAEGGGESESICIVCVFRNVCGAREASVLLFL